MLALRRSVVGTFAACAAALVIGIPSGVVETSWYTRMTPVLWWNYPVWAIASVLTGGLLATYVRDPAVPALPTQSGRTLSGTMLSLVSVGCPICNKLVVMAIGVSGALTWFAPIQPLLAVASVGILGYALSTRLRTMRACRISASGPSPVPEQTATARIVRVPGDP